MESKYLKVCKKAQKSKKINPNKVNLDCETMIYNLKNGEADIKDIKWTIKWYEDALKNGELDWNAYNKYYKSKKRSKKKSKKRSKKRSRKINKLILKGLGYSADVKINYPLYIMI